MHYNLALQIWDCRLVSCVSSIYSEPFEDYCAHADECQRLADRYPALKQGYEGLAHQWRELAKHGEHCRA